MRSNFNIPGIDRQAIGAIKRKSLMKERFSAAGIAVARGRVCRTAQELRSWIDEIGYPVVAKPDVGVGAALTYKLEGDADAERLLAGWSDREFIIEEYVEGQILTYDGLADASGSIVFDSTLVYSTGVMESVNERLDVYYWIPREIPADVRAVGQRMALTFDVRERPFHFEMFRMADGKIIALEVNMRPPGGPTVDMFNYANDIDFYQQWANVVVHGRFEANLSRPYACLYVSRRDHRHYAMAHHDVLRDFGPLLVYEARMESVFTAAMGDQAYVLRGPDITALIAAAQAIQALA